MSFLTPIYLIIQTCLLALMLTWYVVPLRKRHGQIKANHRRINEINEQHTSRERQRTETDQELFQDVRWAWPHFNKFIKAWRDARLPGEERATIRVRLTDYLTPQAVVHGAANQRISEALPGIFLAIGIFGTFLGLVIGLGDLSLDGDLKQMEVGVRTLVKGLSLAFFTSLLGIGSSLLFSLLHKAVRRSLELAVYDLESAISDIYPCASGEYYGRKFLELQCDIKAQMQTLATDIATKIADSMEPAMGNAVSEHLAPIIVEMREAMSRYVELADQRNSEAVEGMLSQYVEMLQGTFSSQIGDITQMIRDTTEAQSSIRNEMGQFSEHLQRQFSIQSELIEKTGRAGEILNDSLASLSTISLELKSSASEVTSAATLLADSAQQAKEGQKNLGDLINRQIEAMATTKEELEISWQTISAGMRSVVEHTRNLIDRMADTLGEHLTGALNAFDGKLAEVVGRFSGTLLETKDTIGELPNLLGDIKDSFTSIANDLESQSSLLSQLRDTTQNLVAPNVEKAAEATINLAATTDRAQHTVAGFFECLDRLDEKFHWYLEQFEQLNNKAGYTPTPIAPIAGNGNGHLREPLQKLSDQLGGLQNVATETRDKAGELFDVLQAFFHRVSEVPSRVDNGNGTELEVLVKRLDGTHQQVVDVAIATQKALQGLDAKAERIADNLLQLQSHSAADEQKRGVLGGLFRK